MIRVVSHLLADDPADGIEAMVGHMRTAPALAAVASSRIARQQRGRLEPPCLQADIIVSHLPVNWRNFAYLTALRALHPATPLVHVEHALGEAYVAGVIDNPLRFDALVGATYALFDRVVAQNALQQRWMLSQRFVPAQRVMMIEPAADLAPLLAMQRRPVGDRVVLAAIEAFDRQSGVDSLIDAVTGMERGDLTLRLVGYGPRHTEIAARARGHAAIQFIDRPADLRAVFADADALAVAARWDTSGLRALQGMASGLPVYCSPSDASRGLVAAGAIGVPENSGRSWRETLARYDLRTVDISRGRRHAGRAEARFSSSWKALVGQLGCTADSEAKAAA